MTSLEKIKDISDHATLVRSLLFSPDGNILASLEYNDHYHIKVWSIEDKKELVCLQKSNGFKGFSCYAMNFSPEGKLLAAGTVKSYGRWIDTRLVVVDVFKKKIIASVDMNKPYPYPSAPDSVIFNPKSDSIAAIYSQVSSYQGGDIFILKIAKSFLRHSIKEIGHMRGHIYSGPLLTFDPSGHRLAVTQRTMQKGSAPGEVLSIVDIWDVQNETIVDHIEISYKTTNFMWPRTIHFSADGNLFITNAEAEKHPFMIWDNNRRRCTTIRQSITPRVYSASINIDGTLLAFGDVEGAIELWDLSTGRPLAKVDKAHNYLVRPVVFSPNGKLLASGANNIALWRVQ